MSNGKPDSPGSARLLLVDDDVGLCELLCEYLGAEGFQVSTVHDASAALELSAQAPFDLVILDVMLPGGNGFDVLRGLRQRGDVPVLMLTARGEDVDRIVGLEIGADDYVPKPCNPRELVARIRAVLRRIRGPASEAGEAALRIDDLEIRGGERLVLRAGEAVELTATEFNVLVVLIGHAGQVVGKEALYEQALGRPLQAYDRSVDMHVSRLRRKLGPAPDGGERIKTVRGSGYQFLRRG